MGPKISASVPGSACLQARSWRVSRLTAAPKAQCPAPDGLVDPRRPRCNGAGSNASQFKHKYLDGVIYAIQGEAVRGMAGSSQVHARIIRNAGFALHSKLLGTPCEVLSSDMRMRLRIANVGAVFYPDVLVHCEPATANPATITELRHARLVIEVLSPTTQQFDRGAKLQAHQKLAGLRHIVLLSSTKAAGWTCACDETGPWSELEPWPCGTVLELPGLGLSLGWDEVYAGVGLD